MAGPFQLGPGDGTFPPKTSPTFPLTTATKNSAAEGETIMGKRARKKKARKKSSANHGKRPNS
jgi:hypothetical protein